MPRLIKKAVLQHNSLLEKSISALASTNLKQFDDIDNNSYAALRTVQKVVLKNGFRIISSQQRCTSI